MNSRDKPKESDLNKKLSEFQIGLEEGMAAFKRGAIFEYREKINYTASLIRFFCEANMPDIALSMELSWYPLVKQMESDEHYYDSFKVYSNELWMLGRRNSPGPISSGDQKKVAFIAQNSVLLGHTEAMLLIMNDWRQRYPDVEMIFLGMTPCQVELERRLKSIGVRIVCHAGGGSPTKTIEWLREKVMSEGVGTAVWLSLPIWISYIFGFRVAKRQVFWSLKFHAVHLGDDVIHIGMTKKRDGQEVINGSKWLSFQPPLSVTLKQRGPGDRELLRGDLNSKFVFTTLARDEKFNSPRFAGCVAEILSRAPASVYIFTGRNISDTLRRALKEKGVADRCIFAGWVDTEVYAFIADCFLETFPFGCGVTGMQALRQGTKLVSLWDSDTLPRFYFNDLREASSFNKNWLVNETAEEYSERAVEQYQMWLSGEHKREDLKEVMDRLEAPRYRRFHDLVFGGS